ncbi:integral peroxisomal membrane peroxin-domain-containing protein [Tricladium varicosporioides]|nr:integral peroxisomal membrane peroxin-domain-containing protein [Hymenoscyphus varicosporioides]
MDEFSADTFVNRDEPIPVVRLEPQDDLAYSEGEDHSSEERKRDVLKRHGKNLKENLRKAQDKVSDRGSSMQDRLLEKLLQQVIPIEDETASRNLSSSPQSEFVTRPSFNITTMSNNFRRFNARIGVVFVFQAKIIRLLSWHKPTHTLSLLATYTFVCLDPYLITVLPLALLLLGLLIPSFIARHPAPPSTISTSTPYQTHGPALAPAPTVKPVKELSKDFFRNMRDLQNSMEDFSQVHDRIVHLLTPPTNFSNEPLSSFLFLSAFLISLLMFIASDLIPWRILFLLSGWATIALGHPTIQRQFIHTHEHYIRPQEKVAKSYMDQWISHDIILDSAPQTREVEIFELQKLSHPTSEWESWLFSSSPYDPLSEGRIRGERPKGTRFFEDVRAPEGWEWSEKKWALDLWSREWVEERIITGVEVETEGERWVYDLRYEVEYDDSEYGDFDITPKKDKDVKGKRRVLPSWEEGSDAEGEGRGRRGEWRRRRWVRMVKRKWQPRRASDVGN